MQETHSISMIFSLTVWNKELMQNFPKECLFHLYFWSNEKMSSELMGNFPTAARLHSPSLIILHWCALAMHVINKVAGNMHGQIKLLRYFTTHNATCTTDWKKALYVMEKDLYVRILHLRLILHYRFFSCSTVIFIGRMRSTRVLSKM
jgi:hypothetical protein